MHVEIWSDVVCPWCYIGKRRFEAALGRFEHADTVRVTWRSFELNPRAPTLTQGTMAEHLAAKYGQSVEEAEARLASMDEMAAAEGLPFRLAQTKSGNTFDAHRLIHMAADHGVADEVKEALLSAYFIRLVPIGDRETLAEVVAGCGLERSEIDEVLSGDRYASDVRADEQQAQQLGATGVPFYVFDRKFSIPGAQDPDTFLGVMRRAYERAG